MYIAVEFFRISFSLHISESKTAEFYNSRNSCSYLFKKNVLYHILCKTSGRIEYS